MAQPASVGSSTSSSVGSSSLADHDVRLKHKPTVLFLCDGQEGYSLVAGAILAHKADSHFDSYSAYTSASCDVATACQTLKQYNIACSDSHFRPIEAYHRNNVDYLIALNPASVQSGKPLPKYEKFIPWDITEGGESSDRQKAIKYINDQINYFLSVYLYR
ncbi:hypothetical protein D515_04674 [Grimontia indica]|uniref:Uncharacterized protein n=1 Tax=Grimontia indica TaxID=1056512 RepID=R1IP00_9GAMM|nr:MULTISPECIES: hypothetical protein [Grimontia]EOD77090.1 hypothetical protein D515_04674 [Grimontia indica]